MAVRLPAGEYGVKGLLAVWPDSDKRLFLQGIFTLAGFAFFEQSDGIPMTAISRERQPVQCGLVVASDQLSIHVSGAEQVLGIDITTLGGAAQILQTTALVCPADAAAVQQSTQLGHRLDMAVVG